MPKTSHSTTRLEHRGPRHDADPDRRVKYVLRYQRKGDEVTPQVTLVRRHRRSQDRQVAPGQRRLRDRVRRRRRRQSERVQLDEVAALYNTYGATVQPVL